jgi:integrase
MSRAHERRRRAATEAHVIALLYALPDAERPLWATALCLGVRRAELRELRWSDIDFTAKVIHVTRSVDAKGEVLDPKTEAGVRDVPMLDRVYRALVAHKLATGRDGDDLVFGRTATDPFVPSTVRSRAVKAWKTAGLKPVTLHEGRHTAASVMRAAGLDIKVITEIIGHATVATTQDRYTHVSAEHLRRAAERLDAHYLAAVNE